MFEYKAKAAASAKVGCLWFSNKVDTYTESLSRLGMERIGYRSPSISQP
jgi:hypothetical protein